MYFNDLEKQKYSFIMTDPYFENRLKLFDPNLKLMFDQAKKRWCVIEWAPDGRGTWNTVIVAEDNDGNPKPLGEWVFNRLYVYRHRWEEKMRNPRQFTDDLFQSAEDQAEKIEVQESIEHQHKLIDDRNEWKRAAKELNNLPTSDVTAGYPK